MGPRPLAYLQWKWIASKFNPRAPKTHNNKKVALNPHYAKINSLLI